MTLDEAIKHCEEKEREQALNGCFSCAEEHKQLAEWLKDYKRLLEEKTQDEWVPVSERLPNRNGVYNVTRKLKEGETIYFISDASYFDGQNTWHADTGINHGRQYLTDIIAWQPLPEPYKKDCEKNER